MASASLTIAGMFNYRSDLFEDFELPAVPTWQELGIRQEQYLPVTAYTTISFADLIGKICLDSAGFSALYMDADIMKMAIGIWSRTQLPHWQALYNTLFLKYNPLWNKDAFHDEDNVKTDSRKGETISNMQRQYEGENANNGRNTDYVRGYDEGTVEIPVSTVYPGTPPVNKTITRIDKNKSVIDNTQIQTEMYHEIVDEEYNNAGSAVQYSSTLNPALSHNNSTPNPAQAANIKVTPSGVGDIVNVEHDVSNESAGTTGNYKENNTGNETIRHHDYGNIGVTMAQDLIEKTRKLALMNLYEIITNAFIKKFCIMVY